MNKIGIIIPVFNEEQTLQLLYNRLINVINTANPQYSFEIFFVNDGSTDSSLDIIKTLKVADDKIVYLSLSRNYGKEIAMAAALDYISGDAIVIMDADLQDPPELIHTMLAEWEEGYDDVYAKRISRDGETIVKRVTSYVYYRILKRCTRVPIQEDTGDFRLLSRRAIEALKLMRENQRYTKGMFSWIGYKKKCISFKREARVAGETKWNYLRLVELAIEGITSFTTTPLRFASTMGVIVFALAMIYMLYIVVRTMLYGDPVAGYPSLLAIILFLGGIQLLTIGIIGEYLGRVFNETKNRPLYFVDEYSENKNI